MYDYQEVCPVSKAASVLCERWTLQIVREMLFGATRFSEFQKYLPRISPTLLNARLRSMVDEGIVVRRKIPGQRGYEYQLTPCGLALEPLLTEMGKWGIRWVFDNMNPDEINLSATVRDFAVALRTDQLPSGDTTIQLTVPGEEGTTKKFILVRDGASQVCEDNPGHDVDVYLTARLETLAKIWFGEVTVEQARQAGELKVVGEAFFVRNLSKWLGVSRFAPEHPARKARG